MNGRKVWAAVAVAGVAAALLSASVPDRGIGETERCPAAVPGDGFEEKPESDIDDVAIDLVTPEVDLVTHQFPTPWSPRVINDSGQDFSDAVLEVAVDQPSDCKLPIVVGNVPDECDSPEEIELDPSCNEREKTAERCEYTEVSGEDGTGSATRAVCVKEIVAGDNEYTLSLGIPDYEGPQDFSQIDGYPDVEVHSRLTVDDEVVASVSSPVTITNDPALERVDLAGIPTELSSGDTNMYDWGITLTNDTDEDLEKVELEIETTKGSNSGLKLVNDHEACASEAFGLHPAIYCDLEAIPAGESVSFPSKLRATGNTPAALQIVKVRGTGLDPAADDPDGRFVFGVAAAAVKIVD